MRDGVLSTAVQRSDHLMCFRFFVRGPIGAVTSESKEDFIKLKRGV